MTLHPLCLNATTTVFWSVTGLSLRYNVWSLGKLPRLPGNAVSWFSPRYKYWRLGKLPRLSGSVMS